MRDKLLLAFWMLLTVAVGTMAAPLVLRYVWLWLQS